MPRYFFDTADGDCDCDHVGVELTDDKAALRECVRYAGGLLADQPELLDAQSELFVCARSDLGSIGTVRITIETVV